jgi:hypothetical protein
MTQRRRFCVVCYTRPTAPGAHVCARCGAALAAYITRHFAAR